MQIREMERRDLDGVHRLMEQIHVLHLQNRPDVYRDADPLAESEFSALLDDAATIGLAAELDGVVVGFCIAALKQPKSPLMLPVRASYVDALCVDKAYRHRGIAKALMGEAEKASRKAGAETMMLTVWSFNREAVAFYEAIGMTPRNIVMEKRLQQQRNRRAADTVPPAN